MALNWVFKKPASIKEVDKALETVQADYVNMESLRASHSEEQKRQGDDE